MLKFVKNLAEKIKKNKLDWIENYFVWNILLKLIKI